MKKLLAIILATALVLGLTACNNAGGLPDGTYKPVAITIQGMGRIDDSTAMAAYKDYSIIIEGNKFTLKVGGISSSVKYTYKDGKLTMNDSATTELSLDIDFKDDTLFWNLVGGMVLELRKDGVPSGNDNQSTDKTDVSGGSETENTGETSGVSNNSYASAIVGDIIQFGGVDWLVLDIQDGKMLVLSDKVLEEQKYHSKHEEITWGNCSLREYLNGEFYNNAFTAIEKAFIVGITIENKNNQWYDIDGGNDTKDKIFLLSIEEVIQYLGDSGLLANLPGSAISIDDEYNSARIAVDKDSIGECWWWLRSPGGHIGNAAAVSSDGRIDIGGLMVNRHIGVRPALWLNLE